MKKLNIFQCISLLICTTAVHSGYTQDVMVTIDADQDVRAVSPYIYGINHYLDRPAAFYTDVGLRMTRLNGGNNATKYNWRRKITSHPDWYNNVYSWDWDAISQEMTEEHPGIQVMWAFQLLGRVASSQEYNFDDWAYNNSQWWQGVHQNLAGGGVPNEDNPSEGALVEGDVELYTMEWPADSTVAILDHWFGIEGLGFDPAQFLYWNMDNEADIWNGTHDDVMSEGLLPAAEFVDRFIEVAKKARAKFPEIKICGPVTTSEWQWYRWGEESIWIDGTYYCWLEYFLKRIAEEEEVSGIRLLDVVDLHNYPYAPTPADALQVHRMYYDENYNYPGANGVKTINGGWDNSLTKEFIFKRINDWLVEYFGDDHGITLGISEWGPSATDPNICSVVYGSILGTFANNGVEYLTPWIWETGMWETLHLFSRYAKSFSVSSTSSHENTVSAYTTVNESADSMTVIIINRDQTSSLKVQVDINEFALPDGRYKSLYLSSLPATETFVSHTDNALKESSVVLESNSFTLTVPPLSTTAVLFPSEGVVVARKNEMSGRELKLLPNPASDKITVDFGMWPDSDLYITIYDQKGQTIRNVVKHYHQADPFTIEVSDLSEGIYYLRVESNDRMTQGKFAVIR